MTRCAILFLGALALLLSGCGGLAPVYRDVGFQTPKDPPPLPTRKPAPPVNFAAWAAPSELTVASKPLAPQTVALQPIAAQSGGTVEVESLAPIGSAPRPPARQVDVQRPAVQPAAAPVAAAPSGARPAVDRYVVAKGDSLYGIARRFGLPLRAIIDANALQPPYKLDLGQSLTIPQARVHVVVQGDTVFNIARRYDVDRSELMRLNGIGPPYAIPLGQKLILPQPGSGTTTQIAATPPASSGAAATAPATTQSAARPPAASVEPSATAVPKPTTKPVVARRGPIGDPPPRAKSTFLWPVQGPVLSSFGAKKSGVHNDGINIAAPRGTPVRAAENGVVAYAGEELRGFGKLLLIKHADGWVTAYAHNEKLLVEPGDVVKRGQSVARVGASGSVPRPQLHFEVRRGTRAVNPETMMGPRPTTGVKPIAQAN